MGETPNIAARLQAVAGPGSVVISDRTSELVEGYFALESMGNLDLKGVARQVPGYRILGRTEARTRFDAIAGRGLTPLIGRDDALDELTGSLGGGPAGARAGGDAQRRAGDRQVPAGPRAAAS